MSPEERSPDGCSRRHVLRAAGLLLAGTVPDRVTAQSNQDDRHQQRLHWRQDTGGGVFSSPVVRDGTVVVGSQAGSVVAIDTADGTTEWTFETGGPVNSSPLVVTIDAEESNDQEQSQRSIVIVGSDDQQLYALDAQTGDQFWAFETNGRVQASPTIADGTVYVSSDNDGIYAIEAATGEKEWYIEDSAVMLSSPTVVGETVFVRSDTLIALDIENGWERWEYEIGSGTFSSPTVAGETVYIGDREIQGGTSQSGGNIHAIDPRTGNRRFRVETEEFIDSTPTVSSIEPSSARATERTETVFVGGWSNAVGKSDDSGSVFAIDAVTGSQRWQVETGGRVLSSPTTAGGVVFVGSWDNSLYALDANSGETRWQFETDGKVSSSPVVVDGTVFVGGMDGYLYAIDAGVSGSSTDSRVRQRLYPDETERSGDTLIPGGELDTPSRLATGVGAAGGLLSGLGLLYRSRSRD